MKMVNLCNNIRKYSFTLEKNGLWKIILYRSLKELCLVLKSVMVIFLQISRKLPSTSPQMTVTILFLTYVIYWIAMFGQILQMILILAAFITVFKRYRDIDVMKCYTEDDVLSSFLAVFRYAHRYVNTSNINPVEFWSKILSLTDEHFFWKPTTLMIEIWLCAPFCNVSLERLFSKMNHIKTTLRNRFTNDSSNSIFRINISGLSLQSFHDEHLEKYVNFLLV